MSATGGDRSMRKIAALAVVGMVVLALGIAGGSATYAYLSDSETLGTADDPNVIAVGNVASEPVSTSAGNTGTTADVNVQAGTGTDTSAGVKTTAPTENDTGSETPAGTNTTASTESDTETITNTPSPTETPTPTESESETESDTDTESESGTDSESEAETESEPETDEEHSCTGNTGTGTSAGNTGDDCTTASGLTVFGVPAMAAVRREYTLPVSRRGR